MSPSDRPLTPLAVDVGVFVPGDGWGGDACCLTLQHHITALSNQAVRGVVRDARRLCEKQKN